MEIEKAIRELKNKSDYTRKDVVNLIFYLDLLNVRNKEQADKMLVMLKQIETLNKRLDFYRLANRIKVAD